MSELMQGATTTPVSIRTGRALTRLTNDTRMEQATIRSISMVGEFSIAEIQYLKSVQRHAEHGNVDAAEAIALIVDQTVINIARRVARFGQGV